eukprot:15320170-Ditylum_brightwellii.AAC.1
MARTGVATEPFPVNNQANVLGTLTGQVVKFWPPCACVNHAECKNGSGFLVLSPNSQGIKEIYLHCIPLLQLVLVGDDVLKLKSREDLCNGLVSPGSTRVSKVNVVPLGNSVGKGR